jgi:hypothetical protein
MTYSTRIRHYNIKPHTASQAYSLWAKSVAGVQGFAFELGLNWGLGNYGWFLPSEDYTFPTEKGRRVFARVVQTDKVDWDVIKQWLTCCEAEHTYSCAAPKSVTLPGFVVIDCFTRRIVKAPKDCKFVALSYVWGPDTVPSKCSEIPTPAPPLIEDAMICTRKLGLQYLWIDRYCIDQTAETKGNLIHNMDHIYSGAAVTIINAAGEGPSCGLPGVSHVARRSHPSVRVQDQQLKLLPNTRAEIDECKWSKRAWTFQEGLLSRRRLVFTSSQIYFQCQETHYWEMVPFPFSSQPVSLEMWASEGLEATLGPSMRVFPVIEPKSNASKVNTLITEYLRRELSHESDILNAIVGILHHVCYHFWGVPFEPWDVSLGPAVCTDRMTKPDNRFLEALLWKPQYDIRPKISKRQGFPSWSWVAYKGITGVQPRLNTWVADRTDVEVRVQDQSHRYFSVSEYLQDMETKYDVYRFKPCLYLTGWVTYVRFRCRDPLWRSKMLSPGEPMTLVALDDTLQHAIGSVTIMTSLVEHSILSLKPIFDQPWPVLLFVDYTGAGKLCGLVLKPVARNQYERLGVLDDSRAQSMTWMTQGDKPYLSMGEKTSVQERRRPGMEWQSTKYWKLECERRCVELV